MKKFNNKKIYRYRRSYDSEYSAPLVDHHVWPALMQGARVIVKVLFYKNTTKYNFVIF